MVEAGLQEVETYVSCQQNTVAQFIEPMTIMDLCLVSERCQGSRMAKWWREDDGVRKAAWETERTEGGDKMYSNSDGDRLNM